MPPLQRSPRGMSLAELVVASAIGMLMLTATYELMIPGLRSWALSNKRSHVRQSALAVVNRVAHDLRASCIESIWTSPDTVVDPDTGLTEDATSLSFLSACDTSGRIRQRSDGSVIWQCYEVLYLDGPRQILYIGTRPLAFDESGCLVYRLESFRPDPDRDRPLSRGVRGFKAEATLDPLAARFGGTGSVLDPVRTNPVTVTVHVHDLEEDCRLFTAVNTGLAADPANASAR